MIGPLKNAAGEELDHSWHDGDATGDVVVLGHGVTANKDRPFLVAVAERLSEAGVPVLRFSFSGNGDSGGRFEDSTITKEVADLGSVLDALGDRRVSYIGHSMGGAVGVLRASRDERIRFLVSLAGMVDTREFARRKFGGLVPGEGFMWDKPDCPLSEVYMNDMDQIGTVVDRGAEVQVPWLLVHGTTDEVVPLQDSLDIAGRAPERAEVVQLEGADHVFSGAATGVMVAAVADWLLPRLA